MGGAITSVASTISRGIGDVVTGGLAETNLGGGIFKRVGGAVGTALTLGKGVSASGTPGASGAPTQTPMDILVNSGGAPLLTNIALGANPDDALASFLGVSKDAIVNGTGLSAEDQQSITNLRSQLTSIQSNTDMRNQAVQKLTDDFPNYVAQAAPKYAAMWDDNMKGVMDQALSQVGAKYAAGGSLSSGAMAAASARAATGVASDRLNYSTGLALQDYSQQLSETSALQAFQQKMLGQGATQGFNAVQNALSQNAKTNDMTYQNQLNQANANQNSNNAMFGALGGLAGSFLGPIGSAAGSSLASQFGQSILGQANGATGPINTARLNVNGASGLNLFGSGGGYSRYSQGGGLS